MKTLNVPRDGLAGIEAVLKALVADYKIENWKQIALLVDRDCAALHWQGKRV